MLSRHLPSWHIIRGTATQAKVEPRMLFADAKYPIFGAIPSANAFYLKNAAAEVTLFAVLTLARASS